MSAPRVGVLALQGDTREHLAALREAGAEASTVRRLSELEAVDALVIPGGESTTMSHLLRELELLEPLRSRLAEGMPAYLESTNPANNQRYMRHGFEPAGTVQLANGHIVTTMWREARA